MNLNDMRDLLRQDRRLIILRVLSESPGYSANESNLHKSLKSLGHANSRDEIIADIYWLRDQGLLNISIAMGDTVVAKITGRGLDVAEGDAIHPGVKRPRP